MGPTTFQIKLWQILPCVSVSLMNIPFGLMLGWPSPTYPRLLKATSPILISLNESAMIAGFLMIGNILGTPLSSRIFYRAKYGIILSIGFMTCGWIVMWQARDIYWLLGSRFLIGFGHGYGAGQLKMYIREFSAGDVTALLIKQVNLHTFLGIIIIFAFGPFVEFRHMSIISLIITICILFLLITLPNPKKSVKAEEIKIKEIIVNSDIYTISQKINNTESIDCGYIGILKNKHMRNRFLKFGFLVFCQQFSGAPATMVYTQILFKESQTPYPIYFALGYAIIFFLANVLGIFILPRYNKKLVLVFSSCSVFLIIAVQICVLHFKINETYWNCASVAVMYFYIFVHTIGLGNVPFTLIQDYFPSTYHRVVTNFFIILHSTLAIIVTKIFQVLMDQWDLCTGFYLFLPVSLISVLFVTIC